MGQETGIADFAKGYWSGICEMPFWCDRPPSLRFLNAGFFMGPAAKVRRMVAWVLDNSHWIIGTKSDQRVYNQFFYNEPSIVTLDYTASVVLNTLGLLRSSLTIKGEDILSPVTGDPVCFAHFQ